MKYEKPELTAMAKATEAIQGQKAKAKWTASRISSDPALLRMKRTSSVCQGTSGTPCPAHLAF